MSDFENELRGALPRGLKGRPNAVTESEWAGIEDLGPEWTYDRSSMFLGYRGGRGIGWGDDRHVMTVAGSRAGKGVALMIPNLLLYRGSILAIDPKGELAAITCRARHEMGQRCIVLDPFGANGRYASASFNPLDELDVGSPTIVDDAIQIADALIVPNQKDPYWTDNARRMLKMLILYDLWRGRHRPGSANLVSMRKLLMLQDEELQALSLELKKEPLETLLATIAAEQDAFDGVIAGEAESFYLLYKSGAREFGSILSATRTQTEFLDSRKLRDILQRSDFRLADLKRGKATVYLCLPAGRMASHANWLRVMIALSLQAFEREPGKPDIPILLMLDEFPVLGYMRSIEAAAGQIAGFGVKLWTVLQDLGQIKKLYQSSWETFVGNAGVLTFFGNTDLTTLRYVSAKLGRIGMNLERASRASGPDLARGVNPIQEDLRESALLEPHEVELTLARETGRVLVLAAGRKPVILQRARYYADRPFGGLFDDSKETASMARPIPPRIPAPPGLVRRG
ncbi:MAG: type IV secretory system conjugative DNA transfer family protein [Rhodomicrobium sp.]